LSVSRRGEQATADRRSEGPAPTAASSVAPGALGIGLVAAQAAFAATFRGPRERFWSRMTWTGLGLGSFALVASRAARRTRIGVRETIVGLGSAAALYATFQAGDRFARRFVPGGDTQIRDIYALRTLRPREEIGARLATVIGPAEELFWRGLVQEALMARFGRWPGAALAAMAYGGVHVVTGNFTLFGAAGIAGAHWCALYAAGVPLGALVVSHVAWDVWIFLVQPTGEVTPLTSPPSPAA
jgi:membrane protease YdiL (CAAX protease family)